MTLMSSDCQNGLVRLNAEIRHRVKNHPLSFISARLSLLIILIYLGVSCIAPNGILFGNHDTKGNESKTDDIYEPLTAAVRSSFIAASEIFRRPRFYAALVMLSIDIIPVLSIPVPMGIQGP